MREVNRLEYRWAGIKGVPEEEEARKNRVWKYSKK